MAVAVAVVDHQDSNSLMVLQDTIKTMVSITINTLVNITMGGLIIILQDTLVEQEEQEAVVVVVEQGVEQEVGAQSIGDHRDQEEQHRHFKRNPRNWIKPCG